MSSAWSCLNPNRPDWTVVGLLVGAIARFVLPGEQTWLDRFGRGAVLLLIVVGMLRKR